MNGWKIDFPILDFVIALFIGALVGIEREKKQEHSDARTAWGLRTFTLVALVGAVSAWLSKDLGSIWIFIAAGVMVTALIITGYYLSLRDQPWAFGMTTEIAALGVFMLGGVALFGHRELAVTLAVATVAILAYKRPLHGLVGRLGQEDIAAGLKLLFATFIILPVMPNRTIDPWHALNPYLMWWLVILIAALSLVGYVACRWLGTERGTAVTGFFGGIVSSTAVTLSFAKRSREEPATPGIAHDLVAGVLISWAVMCVRIVAVAAVMYRPIIKHLLVPMATMGVPCALLAVWFYRRAVGVARSAPGQDVTLRNPFSLTSAVKFALIFSAVMLLVRIAQAYLPTRGMYLVATLAGLTDVDAIALSMAQYAGETLHIRIAVTAITLAAIANTLVKCGLVFSIGTREFGRQMIGATAIVIAGAGAGIVLFRWLMIA